MFRASIPALLVASILLAGCQLTSNGGSTAGTGVSGQETQEEAIRRIEREGARQRGGGP